MTGAMLAATVFDILAVAVLIYGFMNEDKVIEFEDRVIYSMGRAYKRHKRRRMIKKKAAKNQHLRIVRSDSHSDGNYGRTA